MSTHRTSRRLSRLALVGGIVCAPTLVLVASAEAHPLGQATVNHYNGLTLAPNRIDNFAVVDTAEIPTVARESDIDIDGDGQVSEGERTAYATSQCASLASGVHLTVGGLPAKPWMVTSSSYAQHPGQADLPIGRLECRLTVPVDLTAAATVALDDTWDGAGIGWHEITAVGEGVNLTNSPVPDKSISDSLRRYPDDMLSSPLNIRSAALKVSPGAGASTYVPGAKGSGENWAQRAISNLTGSLNRMIAGHLNVGVGLLAVLLAMLLGAGHAMLPGHGKTIMAAYLVGKRGRLRDVVTVGATVTVTHTAGVLILGLLLTQGSRFAPTDVYQKLSIISGLMVVAVGGGLLVSAVRNRRKAAATVSASVETIKRADVDAPLTVAGAFGANPGTRSSVATLPVADHGHDHPHGDHAHDHPHDDHPHGDHAHGDHDVAAAEPHSHGWLGGGHSHGPGGHTHGPEDGFSRKGLIGLGAAGGLVPSPSALLVLLATVALGRTAFGVLLVVAYGVGMAGALTVAGILLVKFRNRLALYGAGRFRRLSRIAAVMPIVTAVLVILVGLGLAARSLGGSI